MLRSAFGWWLLAICLWSAGAAQAQSVHVPSGTSIALGSGAVDLACGQIDVYGTLLSGSAQANNVEDVFIHGGGTLQGDSATLEVSGSWSNEGSFVAGSSEVVFTDQCATTTVISGNTTFNDLTFSSSSGKVFYVAAGTVITVRGALLAQSSGPPLSIVAVGAGPAPVIIALGDVSAEFAGLLSGITLQIGAAAPVAIPAMSGTGVSILVLLLLLLAAWVRRSHARVYNPSTAAIR